MLRLSLVLLGITLPLLFLEVGLRIENRIRKGTPLSLNPGDKWDTYLGWAGKEHLFEPLSDEPVLVLGDSFTDGLDVPRDNDWLLLPLVLLLVDDIEPYSAALKDVARKLDIPLVIPARAALLGPSDRLPDGTHLNDKGNELVGRTFVEIASQKGILPNPKKDS